MVTSINIVFNCQVQSESMGGGDKIAIELARRWKTMGYPLRFLGCTEGRGMCKIGKLDVDYTLISRFDVEKYGLVAAYILRIMAALFSRVTFEENSLVYSSSDFLPDTLPAWKARFTNKQVRWVGGFYLRALNPFKRDTSFKLRSVLYFLSQEATIVLMKRWADLVLVLCDEDTDYLESKGISSDRIKVISGGCDLGFIGASVPDQSVSYDSCFVGRFHEQKGLPLLIRSWKEVIKNKPNARLGIVGWGTKSWVDRLRHDLRSNALDQNVDLLGFLEGERKFAILKSSKILLFPSQYESWGVVVIEAMACGLPVVAFDLPTLRRNFPKGMKRVPLGDHLAFAEEILRLLDDGEEYQKLKQEGLDLAKRYDWEIVARDIEQDLRARQILVA